MAFAVRDIAYQSVIDGIVDTSLTSAYWASIYARYTEKVYAVMAPVQIDIGNENDIKIFLPTRGKDRFLEDKPSISV